MLRQIEWWVQNRPISMNGVQPATTLFFWKFWFDVPTTQMSIFILFGSAGVIFEGAFSLWDPLNICKTW